MTKYFRAFALLLLALCAQSAWATCVPSGNDASCTYSSEAQAWVTSHQLDKTAACATHPPAEYGVFPDPTHKRWMALYLCDDTPTLTHGLSNSVAGYTTDDVCSALKPAQTVDEWSTGSNDDIPTGGVECYNGCNVNWSPNGIPHWVLAYERFTVQGTVKNTGTSCSTSPPNLSPGAPPPDSDGDGIPNDRDVYPNDPGNTPPPPPPPDQPPPNTPPPPDGDQPATGNDIGTLQQAITAGFISLGNKLDSISQALSAIKSGADLNSSTQVAAIAASTNAIVAAVTAAGGVAVSPTDMTATNALLTTANTQRDAMNTTLTAANVQRDTISATLTDQDTFAHHELSDPANDLHGNLTDPGPHDPNDGLINVYDHSTDTLDDSGLGYGGTCPASPTFSVFGHPFSFNTTVLCGWMTLGGRFVLLLGALASARIMATGAER